MKKVVFILCLLFVVTGSLLFVGCGNNNVNNNKIKLSVLIEDCSFGGMVCASTLFDELKNYVISRSENLSQEEIEIYARDITLKFGVQEKPNIKVLNSELVVSIGDCANYKKEGFVIIPLSCINNDLSKL